MCSVPQQSHFGSFWFWLLMCFRLLCFLRSRPVGRFWRWVWDRRRAGRCRWRRGQSFWWSTCDHVWPYGCATPGIDSKMIQRMFSSYAPRSSKCPVGLVSSGCRSPNTRWRSDRRQNLSDRGRDWASTVDILGILPASQWSWRPCLQSQAILLASSRANPSKSIQILAHPGLASCCWQMKRPITEWHNKKKICW